MPSLEIPCQDCEKKKKEIELAGTKIVESCKPIEGKPGWCLIVWKRK